MMIEESISELKHSLTGCASILSTQVCTLLRMEYGERLEEAIKLAKSSRADLAAAIGKSVQAVGQCITGKTGAFTAENSAKAADFLKVDHYWLATGEGQPRPDRAWPFKTFTPEQFYNLSQEVRDEFEDRLLGKIRRQEISSGEPHGPSFRRDGTNG